MPPRWPAFHSTISNRAPASEANSQVVSTQSDYDQKTVVVRVRSNPEMGLFQRSVPPIATLARSSSVPIPPTELIPPRTTRAARTMRKHILLCPEQCLEA